MWIWCQGVATSELEILLARENWAGKGHCKLTMNCWRIACQLWKEEFAVAKIIEFELRELCCGATIEHSTFEALICRTCVVHGLMLKRLIYYNLKELRSSQWLSLRMAAYICGLHTLFSIFKLCCQLQSLWTAMCWTLTTTSTQEWTFDCKICKVYLFAGSWMMHFICWYSMYHLKEADTRCIIGRRLGKESW